MIVNDTHRFSFIHIPKCAGTSVRVRLGEFDTSGGAFSVSKGFHPEIGQIDMAHIPLPVLKRFFPEHYEKVRTYESFAIVRDPFQRFSSSLYQRLRMFSAENVRALSVRDLEAASEDAISVLEENTNSDLMPYGFIHFQPQHTYLRCDGVQIVRNVFDISDLAEFFAAAGAQLGVAIEDVETAATDRVGAAKFYRSPTAEKIRNILTPRMRRALMSALPKGVSRLGSRLLYEEKDNRFRQILQSQRAIDFVEKFYAADIALYNALSRVNR